MDYHILITYINWNLRQNLIRICFSGYIKELSLVYVAVDTL